jgi:hypothetical protein
MKKTLLSTLCASVLLSAASFSAIAQEYPNKTITMIMPYAPGGPGDTITRKSLFDSLVAGCVPVVFARASLSQYAWFLSTNDIEAISVYLSRVAVELT